MRCLVHSHVAVGTDRGGSRSGKSLMSEGDPSVSFVNSQYQTAEAQSNGSQLFVAIVD
jgi:hypothetical protein